MAARSTSSAVPDAIEPVVGWRTWLVAGTSAGHRLRSVIFPTVWEPGRALASHCLMRPRRHTFKPWRRRPIHDAPDRRCYCGVYGADVPARAAGYLGDEFAAWRAWNRVVGLVALWGDVVECEHGWRGAYAYPTRLYLPTYGAGGRADSFAVRRDLAVYGVPVETVRCANRVELVETLTALRTAPLRRTA